MHGTLQNLLLHLEVDLGQKMVSFDSPCVYVSAKPEIGCGKKEL
jgi:hypothetical protein